MSPDRQLVSAEGWSCEPDGTQTFPGISRKPGALAGRRTQTHRTAWLGGVFVYRR